MKLVIVESPTKAHTLSKFLDKTFSVKSSYGHIRDLPKKEMGIDIANGFKPRYVIPTKARAHVSQLKKHLKKASQVILATDEDREGEAIAWHLVQALDLDKFTKESSPEKSYQRIVFHEITKNAILKALENPRQLDLNLVNAQQARRILDRLVGYELSPFLWKKIKRGLSAGRVQSVALRFVVEREREIEKFKKDKFWLISALMGKDSAQFESRLTKINDKSIEETIVINLFAGQYKISKTSIQTAEKAEEIKKDLEKSEAKVTEVKQKEVLRYPPPPFTTSSLQQAAFNRLNFSSKFTMRVAQNLYEKGYITYMRTDSLNLSLESMLSARKVIAKTFGKEYALKEPRFYKTRSKSAQEAHEAIRPTYPDQLPEILKNKLEKAEFQLYDLIWKRMIASQMPAAVFDSVNIEIEAKNKNTYRLQSQGSTLKFDGYLKVYGESGERINLPKMKVGDKIEVLEVILAEKQTTPPPRYSEATLIKVLEENGIGRPSTYAPTISTIIERKYVEKNKENRLQPLEIGLIVNDLLVKHFPEIVDIKFTATIEEDLDKIAEGKTSWEPVVAEFYEPFHKRLENKHLTVKREDILEKLDRSCPQCGSSLIVKFGKFGKFIACDNFPECKYTEKTAQEKKEERDNADIVCEICGSPMVVKRSRFGSFLGCSRYPSCRSIKKIENKIGLKCPRCLSGDVVIKKTKSGKIFYGCSRYPDCDFASWTKPEENNQKSNG